MSNIWKDGMLGLIVGDALGVPVEFMSRTELMKNPVTGMREYGTHHQPMGTWSDDSSMALAELVQQVVHAWRIYTIWRGI
jgi:ADP-ribosyl-[dinitrogen reductase] hydrolase